MAQKHRPSAAKALPEMVNPDDVQSTYVNVMQMSLSTQDARLIFGEVIVKGSGVVVEERANLVMSIPHLKAMFEVLQRQFSILDQPPQKT